MVIYQLPMGLWYATNWWGGERINKALGGAESTLAGIREKPSQKLKQMQARQNGY